MREIEMADKSKQNKEIRIKPIAPSANLKGSAGRSLIANAEKYSLSSSQQKALSATATEFIKAASR
jgi:hypothetical protein